MMKSLERWSRQCKEDCLRIAELHDCQSALECSEVLNLRHSCAENECEAPVERHEDSPGPFSLCGFERREFEGITQHGSVENFQSDVAVQKCSNNRNGKVEGISECLEAIAGGRNA